MKSRSSCYSILLNKNGIAVSTFKRLTNRDMGHTETNTNRDLAILLLFFLTGLTGLAYELVWIRLLILVFGSTQFAFTTVLTTFMAGLALGSLIFGRLVDRHDNPLKLYGILELALGAYCLASPLVFEAVRYIYLNVIGPSETGAGFNGVQFGLAFIALIVPTTLMGGTLPIIVKYLTKRQKTVGFNTALAYSVNTIGAVVGCLITGLATLYLFGVKSTLYGAGLIDIAIGIVLIGILSVGAGGYKSSKERTEEEPCAISKTGDGRALISRSALFIIISIFAISGFCSLVYEVLWTRVLSLIIGSSVYAFTIMLATFLLGIGLGSIIFAPFIDRCKKPVFWFAVLEAVIGLSSLGAIFFYKELPFIFYEINAKYSENFALFLTIEFFFCAALMIIPTLSMGAIFPLVGKIYARGGSSVGRTIGDVYFFNTAGAIFGAFLGGFVLMPILGVQKAVILTAAINIAAAVILVFVSSTGVVRKAASSVLFIALFIALTVSLPNWDRMIMTLGLYSNVVGTENIKKVAEGNTGDHLAYYKEGVNAIITVRKSGPGGMDITYQANGKQEARARGPRPAEAWSLLGHIPVLMMKEPPQNALLVGLGSGITLGALTRYPFKSIDAVELEPAVVVAASYFYESNNDALEDKRVKLHLADGRNFLFTTKKKYDVIVSAVSDPWISGVSNLFTYEYFTRMSEQLNEGGTTALWFQNYRIRPAELKIGLKTFATVFPYVSIYFHYTNTTDLIVIGSNEPHAFDMGTLDKYFRIDEVRDDLRRIDITGPLDLLDLFLIGDKDLRAYMGDAIINTDERPFLEFALPKLLYMDPARAINNVQEIIGLTTEVLAPVTFPERWTARDRARFYFELGKKYANSSFRLRQAVKLFEKALIEDPAHKAAREHLKMLKRELGLKDA